jgi:hypothetical protein
MDGAARKGDPWLYGSSKDTQSQCDRYGHQSSRQAPGANHRAAASPADRGQCSTDTRSDKTTERNSWAAKHQSSSMSPRCSWKAGPTRDGALQLPLRANICRHCRPGEGAGGGVGAKHRPDHVGNAHGHDLLLHVDFILVLAGEGFGDGDGLHESDDEENEGRAELL